MAPENASGIDPADVGRWWKATRMLGKPATKLLWRVKLEGIEHLPDDGPAIIAPNHISFIDSTFLLMLLPRQITFVGKAEYMDSWKTKYLFPAIGMIPIDRRGGKSSVAALDAACGILERGGWFGIYPEGTRSRSGELHKGHTGVARVALRTGAPIIPTGIVGTDRIQPPDTPMPRPFQPATIRFGRPVDPRRYADRDDDRLVHRQLTDEVMFEIAGLTGQRYVDRYATKKKTPSAGPSEPTAAPDQPALVPDQGESGIDAERRSSASVLAAGA